ncbi:MAG: TolC family outer membrane protein [Gammaproteobacteria bacterium]|nr:TolC family outer membrane protein [Gammaproteobacteria bacterium]
MGTAEAENIVEIYEFAKLNDADYRAAEAALRASLEADPQARAALRPQIGLSADLSYVNTDDDVPGIKNDFTQGGLALSLSQSLYRRDLRVQLEQVGASVAQAKAEFEAADEALILRVSEAYFDVLAALDNLDFAEAEKEAIAQQLEQAQRRFEVGLIAITDVKEAQAQFDLSVAAEIQAENLLATTRQALVVITGTPFEELQRVADDAPLNPPDPDDIEQWVSIAQEQNLSLIAARFAAEVARQGIEINRSDNYPTLDLVAQYAYLDKDGGFNEGDSNTASIGVQLNYPLYTSGARGSRIEQARAEFETTQEFLEKQRRTTVQQARDAYLTVIAAISSVRALKQALESSQAANEATQAGFEVGTRTAVDVLITLRSTYEAQRDYARARYDYILNMLSLYQAAGILAEEHLEAIARWLR